ncbi:hypothetical protein BGX31_006349 [Mortierella sp. GBA43]|nr:hypothetical protein BGX31_006349 [Mortierella sp. GBA43]
MDFLKTLNHIEQDLTGKPTLSLTIFMELANAGVYQRENPIQNAKVLEEYWQGSLRTHSDSPTYNIILFGPTQAGKSTFLEGVKKYANPSYVLNRDRVGLGNKSKTTEIFEEVVETTLPVYKLYDKDNDNREIDVYSIKDEKALKKLFVRDDDELDLKLEEVPGSKTVRFRFIDTPGLDDTDGNDVKHFAKIISGLTQAQEFHLVILMDSHHVPFVQSQKDALGTYFHVLEELKSMVLIVHTHVPNLHHRVGSNQRFDTKLSERAKYFCDVIGRQVPTKRIDCDLDEIELAQIYLTRNMIREILQTAVNQAPVSVRKTHIPKFPVMATVDTIVHQRCQVKIDSINKTCDTLREINAANQKLNQLNPKIEQCRKDIRLRNDRIREHDTRDKIQLFHQNFNRSANGWHDVFGGANGLHRMEFHRQEHTIEHVDVGKGGIEWANQEGGVGQQWWKVTFKRKPFERGRYDVTLYTFKRTKHKNDIAQWTAEKNGMNKTLDEMSGERDKLLVTSRQNPGTKESVEQLTSKAEKYRNLANHTCAKTITMDMFQELAHANVYQRSDDVNRNADKLLEYLERKFGIK